MKKKQQEQEQGPAPTPTMPKVEKGVPLPALTGAVPQAVRVPAHQRPADPGVEGGVVMAVQWENGDTGRAKRPVLVDIAWWAAVMLLLGAIVLAAALWMEVVRGVAK